MDKWLPRRQMRPVTQSGDPAWPLKSKIIITTTTYYNIETTAILKQTLIHLERSKVKFLADVIFMKSVKYDVQNNPNMCVLVEITSFPSPIKENPPKYAHKHAHRNTAKIQNITAILCHITLERNQLVIVVFQYTIQLVILERVVKVITRGSLQFEVHITLGIYWTSNSFLQLHTGIITSFTTDKFCFR